MLSEKVSRIIEAYAAAWSVTEEPEIGRLLESAWAPDGEYADPTTVVEGRDALRRHIAGFKQRYPGARIEMTSAIDGHHRWGRFAWKIVKTDGATLIQGMDFGELDRTPQLRRIVGFFEAPPQTT